MISHDPLHRSGLAALPHPALASGRDVEALARPGMVNADFRDPSIDEAVHTFPRERTCLTPATQSPAPRADHSFAKCTQPRAVAGHSVVAKVPADDSTQVLALLGNWIVHASPQLGSHLAQLRLPAFAYRLPHQHVPTAPIASTHVSEAEEVEGAGLGSPTIVLPLPDAGSERQKASLVGMELQTELCEPVAQLSQEPLGILAVLESDDEVIRIAHDDHSPRRLHRPPLLDPQIEHVVQVQVRQQRTDASALDGSRLARCPRPILQHTCGEPLLDQPYDALVRDLDDLLPVDATDEQRAMHAERMETYWAAERERLWPALQGQRIAERTVDVDLSLADYDALVEIRKALGAFTDTPTRWFNTLDMLIQRLPRRSV
jgi:hypothetical protein